ncbi:TRAP transporter small permease subunit [Roseicella aerolata]|jgi:TRAP-type mannitol/chloroaromatic compound transport system permease small subunit|uniref:TRAP transporter small permease protein n=1 Tax=Roseicella aerolata TaxID=2883479 RepID=A0A9X1IJI6_9PROT|nr:TRAP transporter small permease subunit [Roseicella aerolata]MCB4824533.1 TRAP transporter small permease subunit [Roseicella aerolata]
MGPLFAFSRGVDRLNAAVGKLADWAVLLACAVSASNALMRYGISYSSNAWLEVQWYLFAAIVMLGTSYTLFRNAHVRVDLVYGALSERGRLWVDVVGIIVFLLPACVLLTWMTWPFFLDSFLRDEGSPNAGGLLRWPVKILMPIGFLLLTLQGLSELIKRFALLRGIRPAGEVVVEYERLEQ